MGSDRAWAPSARPAWLPLLWGVLALAWLSRLALGLQRQGADVLMLAAALCELAALAVLYRLVQRSGRDRSAPGHSAEDRLWHSEESLRRLVDSAPDTILVTDGRGLIQRANPSAQALLGYTPDELVGMSLTQLMPGPDAARHDGYMRDHAQRRRGMTAAGREVQARRKDGSLVTVHVRVGEMPYRDGHCFVGFMRDMTEHRQAQAALQRSEEKLRKLYDLSPLGIALTEMDGRFIDFNEAFAALCGHDPATLRSLSYWDLTPIEYADQEQRNLELLERNGRYGPYEKEYRCGDGQRRPVRLNGVRIELDGRPCIWSIVEDLSARRAAERERERLQRQLMQSQKMEALGQLTGGIAHDFNNMLTGILGLSTLALERHVDDPSGKLASYLREIARVGERGRELVGRLMRFARPVAAGAPPPAARPLQPIVEEALVMLAPALSPRISVRLQAEAGLPELCFTEVDMHQVLTNLLINARDAMGGEGEVVVTLARAATEGAECTSCGQRAHGEHVSLRVQDSGPGIAPEFRARIFDPFFTTKDIGKGTGLGLAMVHSLVHQIGGHIVVHGEPGRGTCFELLLPVTPPRAVDAAAEAQATAASEPAATVQADDATPDGPGCALTGAPMDAPPGAPPGAPMDAPTEAAAVPARRPVAAAPKRRRSGRRVWLIDDAGTAFVGLEPVLRAAGYSVSRHTDPLRVLQALRTTPVAADHLVTVQSMARMTGGELAQATLALQPAPSVLLCAGPDDGIDDMALQALGIRHVLRRPVSAGTLIHALAAAERQREAGQPA